MRKQNKNICYFKDYLCNYKLFGFVKLVSDHNRQKTVLPTPVIRPPAVKPTEGSHYSTMMRCDSASSITFVLPPLHSKTRQYLLMRRLSLWISYRNRLLVFGANWTSLLQVCFLVCCTARCSGRRFAMFSTTHSSGALLAQCQVGPDKPIVGTVPTPQRKLSSPIIFFYRISRLGPSRV